LTAPAPRRRAKSYDSSTQWRAKHVYIPAGLADRLKKTSEATRKAEKDIIIEALEAKLSSPNGSPKPSD
jgi:hypothetical protein